MSLIGKTFEYRVYVLDTVSAPHSGHYEMRRVTIGYDEVADPYYSEFCDFIASAMQEGIAKEITA